MGISDFFEKGSKESRDRDCLSADRVSREQIKNKEFS